MAVVPLRWPASHHAPVVARDYALHGRPATFSGDRVRSALAGEGTAAVLVNGWVGGFLTGVNMTLPETYDISPFAGSTFVCNLILAECMSDPEQPLHEAARQVVQALVPARAQCYSEAVTLSEGARQVMIRRETLKFVQHALIRRGFLVPPRADGCDSAALRSALRTFQAAVGLTPSGLPDSDTVLALLPR